MSRNNRIAIKDYTDHQISVACDLRWKVNAVCISCGGTSLIVDTLGSPLAAQQAKDAWNLQPISAVINTHHHYDHILGNQVFADAEIHAHRRVPEWMDRYEEKLLGEIAGRPSFADFKLIRPSILHSETSALNIQGETVEIVVPGPCHTDNDVFVSLPERKLLVVGDIHVPNTVYPINLNSGGDISNWINTLERLRTEYHDYLIIPGHFEPATEESLQLQQAYLQRLFDLAPEQLVDSEIEAAMLEFTEMRNFSRYNYTNLTAVRKFLEN